MTVKDRWRVEPTPVNPWPFLALVTIVIGGLLAWGSLTPTGFNESSGSASAPLMQTVIVTATETSTPVYSQTARVVVQTPTGTSTPLIPLCQNAMRAGDLCVQEAAPRTATSYPECPRQRTYELICRKALDGTEAEEVSK